MLQLQQGIIFITAHTSLLGMPFVHRQHPPTTHFRVLGQRCWCRRTSLQSELYRTGWKRQWRHCVYVLYCTITSCMFFPTVVFHHVGADWGLWKGGTKEMQECNTRSRLNTSWKKPASPKTGLMKSLGVRVSKLKDRLLTSLEKNDSAANF